MRWFKKKTQSEYMQTQFHILSSVGLFYLIIVGLFAIPLLATFVVVLIQGVFDFRYVILSVGAIVVGLMIYYAGKLCYRLFRKIKQDGAMAIGHARERARQGESVQLQLLGGLFSLSYGRNNGGNIGNKSTEPIVYHGQDSLLIEDRRENQIFFQDPVQQIKELSALKDQGIIDEEEFRKLKEKLIRNVCAT
jgi:uncharacterized integral membrane protein